MYSSCAHCKQNFFYKSECCWTYRTVAPTRSKRFNENTITFSNSTVRIKLKVVIMCNNNEMCIDRQNHVLHEPRTLENCRNPAAFDPLATRQFTQQDNG